MTKLTVFAILAAGPAIAHGGHVTAPDGASHMVAHLVMAGAGLAVLMLGRRGLQAWRSGRRGG